MNFKSLSIFVIVFYARLANSVVLELDDRFREAKKQGEWLVMFYAPWCGHCKHLEPTWMEVGEAMKNTMPVHVARLDCTKYSSLSSDFGVRGFPTIKFISGDNEYEYRGARTKSDIIAFTLKARGPKLTSLTNSLELTKTRELHSVFFLYVGNEDSDLREIYGSVADKLFLTLNMFAASPDIMPDVKETPTVLVFKDDTYFRMPLSSQSIKKAHLTHWMLSEQLPDYNELTGSSYHSLKGTHKQFAIAVLAEKDYKYLDTIAKDIATSRNPLFHPKFIFCWVLGDSIINKITYSSIPTPNFIVFDPSTYEYFTMRSDSDETKIVKSDITRFLSKVIEGEIASQGGSGVFQQIKRFVSDTTNIVINFFKESPIVASLVIGIPTFVITFLCYCLCTMEDSEAGDYHTDSENDSGEDDKEEEESEMIPEYQDDTDKNVRKRNVEQDSQDEESQAEESQDEEEQTAMDEDDTKVETEKYK
uniref:protein disulfide-isomerase TMX3-like n=1 Tax=Styela clava TaxID=7725 RepID=UPI00193A18DF|nr:protein disulfide-isomerase TMX3-like [Styela clava]